MTMCKNKLALAVALGLGMSSPLWAADGVSRPVWQRWRRVQAAEARATAAARADEAQSKANEARETAVVAKAQSEKVDKQTAGAQGFEFTVMPARASWSTAMATGPRRPLHHPGRLGGRRRGSPGNEDDTYMEANC